MTNFKATCISECILWWREKGGGGGLAGVHQSAVTVSPFCQLTTKDIDWSLSCWTLYKPILNWLRSECWGSAGAVAGGGWSCLLSVLSSDQTWQTFSRALYLSSNPWWSADWGEVRWGEVRWYHILTTDSSALSHWGQHSLCSLPVSQLLPTLSLSFSLSLWPRLTVAEAVRAAVVPGAILQTTAQGGPTTTSTQHLAAAHCSHCSSPRYHQYPLLTTTLATTSSTSVTVEVE